MKIPRDLRGQDLVKLLCKRWGYRVIHQKGSHIGLETPEPFHQRIAVPAHKALLGKTDQRTHCCHVVKLPIEPLFQWPALPPGPAMHSLGRSGADRHPNSRRETFPADRQRPGNSPPKWSETSPRSH